MIKSNLIPVLKSFSKDEIKEFEKFLDSPFFGCGKFVLKFYKVLIKHYPVFNEEDIKKEKIFGIVYKDKKYNDALTRRIISDLIRFSEEYITYKNFKNNNAFYSSCSLNELRNRKLHNLFRLRSESILKKINKSEIGDPDRILESYFTNFEIGQYRTFIRDEKMHESRSLSAEAITVYFLRVISYYLIHSINFTHETNTKNKIISAFLNNFNFESFFKLLENDQSKFSVYLKMLGYVYQIVADKEDRQSCTKLNELISANPGFLKKK